jgi:hypothetical protein
MAATWVNAETTRDLKLEADELQLDVLLDGRHLNQWTQVSIICTSAQQGAQTQIIGRLLFTTNLWPCKCLL